MKRNIKYSKEVDDVSKYDSYIVCEFRKGRHKINSKICRVCEEDKCKERKNLPIIRISKFYEVKEEE